jgi:hypothetical protein
LFSSRIIIKITDFSKNHTEHLIHNIILVIHQK